MTDFSLFKINVYHAEISEADRFCTFDLCFYKRAVEFNMDTL